MSGLKFFAWLEPDSFAFRNGYLRAGSRISSDAALTGFDHKDAKATKLNAFALLHGALHSFKESLDGNLGLHLWYPSSLSDMVDDIQLDHRASVSDLSINRTQSGRNRFLLEVRQIVRIIGTVANWCQVIVETHLAARDGDRLDFALDRRRQHTDRPVKFFPRSTNE